MIETLTRPATTTASASRAIPANNLPIAASRLAAGAALGVSLTTRIAATLTGVSSIPLLAALLLLSMLAFVIATEEPAKSTIDQRATSMCRRAATLQSIVGVAALALAAF